MITLSEILKDQCTIDELDEATKKNIYELLDKINKVRERYGYPMIVTSGYRTLKHHLEIYKKKGVTDKSKIPLKSNHLTGCAVDISDPNRKLQKWCLENVGILASIGLWMEDFKYTPTWCHFQVVPPKSGKRFFIP